MTEIMTEIMNYALAFGGLLFTFFLFLNFLTKGFLFTYLRVKASQGRLLLVRVHSATEQYHKVGKWTDGFIKFRNKEKEDKPIPITKQDLKGAIVQTMGVPMVEVDDSGNKIVLKDFSIAESAVDAGELETVLIRQKNRPQLDNKKQMIIILLLVGILLAVGFVGYRVLYIEEIIVKLGELSGNI